MSEEIPLFVPPPLNPPSGERNQKNSFRSELTYQVNFTLRPLDPLPGSAPREVGSKILSDSESNYQIPPFTPPPPAMHHPLGGLNFNFFL